MFAANRWPEGNAMPGVSGDDMQTLRILSQRYGSMKLITAIQLLDASSRNSSMSTFSNHRISSVAPSILWSSSESSACASDAASINGSFLSQTSWSESIPEPSILHSDTASMAGSDWQSTTHTSLSPVVENILSSTTKQSHLAGKKPIECPMCTVYGLDVGFGRKSDFKKHLQNFHRSDCLWVCSRNMCRMVFDFEKAYIHHVKVEHQDQISSAESAKVQLCPQVVFACGFLNCKEVFEAANDGESSSVADKYFEHLSNHFDRKVQGSEWAYHAQMQNLLRQRALKQQWKTGAWNKDARNKLRWQPRSSADLKKLLECRHLEDIPRILNVAFTLGSTCFTSPHQPPPMYPGAETRPVRSKCPMVQNGHAEFHITHPKHAGPQAVMAFRRGLLSSKVPIMTHPTPRSIPEEPSSIDHPHPGTLFEVPDEPAWASGGPNFGPDEDENMFDPSHFHSQQQQQQQHHHHHQQQQAPMSQDAHPLSQWTGIDSLGAFPSMNDYMIKSEEPYGQTLPSSGQAKTPKRHISLCKKSLDNLRHKRRGPAASEPEMIDAPPMPSQAFSPNPSVYQLPSRPGTSSSMTDAPPFYPVHST